MTIFVVKNTQSDYSINSAEAPPKLKRYSTCVYYMPEEERRSVKVNYHKGPMTRGFMRDFYYRVSQ